ncbi:MAG: glycosyltransferase family 2 protein [Actinobacteria bacterium]|nr:glycosyltransferase family 2 protein [Actinomycetota bacterium]
MTLMKISVVIPAHNEEKYIERCLKSLMDQDEKADEIIVVNSNCTDRTIEICKNYPVTILDEFEKGIIPARNKGFNAASGEIIARCDADTIVPKDWIKKIKQHFINKDIVAVGGPVMFFDLPLKTPLLANGYSVAHKKLYKNHVLLGANMAVKKSAWDEIKNKTALKDKHVHEDIDLAFLLGTVGEVLFDRKMVMSTSGRRIKKKPHSFFVEYPIRLVKTYRRHSKNGKKN